MLTRILTVVIVVPIAVILIALAVANRAFVPFTMDPFNPGNPGLTIQMPFFIYLFLALILGVLIGSFATWLRQARYRRLARQRGHEIDTLLVANHNKENAAFVDERAYDAPSPSRAYDTPATTNTALARTGS